jgi:hypothetical protein
MWVIRSRTPVCRPLRFRSVIADEHLLEWPEGEICQGRGRFNSHPPTPTNGSPRHQRARNCWRGKK